MTPSPDPAPVRPDVDVEWLTQVLVDLARIPSPTGRTDQVMQYVGDLLVDELGLEVALTRRGAMVATLGGVQDSPDRAVIVHSDTIGAMVREVLPSGRLALVPVGTHSARFAEGSRVTIFTDEPGVVHTGTILPTMASGHAFGDAIDTQGVGWDHVEVRVDAHVRSPEDTAALGIRIGDHVAMQALPEVTPTGFVKSRHLDDKAGIAAVLAGLRGLLRAEVELPVTAHLLVTISEEVGHGASHGLHTDVAEMVSVDAAVVAPGQASTETGVTIAMQDLHGPFDYHLTRKLLRLGEAHGLEVHRDVFRYYRSDVAAALEAGAETRAALIGFGVDATHGFERTHLDSLRQTAELVALYLQTDLTFEAWDQRRSGQLADFPSRSVQPADKGPVLDEDGASPSPSPADG
ncbi:MAG: osmoprotectant NAGGN system M42 family peptidase [Actinomycetes bacterium]